MNELDLIYKTIEKIKHGVSLNSDVNISIKENRLVITVLAYTHNTPLYSWVEITRQEMIGCCNYDIIVGCFIHKTNRVFKQLLIENINNHSNRCRPYNV